MTSNNALTTEIVSNLDYIHEEENKDQAFIEDDFSSHSTSIIHFQPDASLGRGSPILFQEFANTLHER